MGNFSRNPKDRLKDSISKHYTSVQLQQGVPLLDADWNEMDGLRKYQTDNLGRLFIGDGVPSGDDGFRILENNEDNNFTIRKGIILVKGKEITNDNDCTYLNQPNSGLVDPLTTPVAKTNYVIYLDTWEEEYDYHKDEKLFDERIGVETCVRLKRVWVVRCAKEPEGLVEIENPSEGHCHYILARILREANKSKISDEIIQDLRCTQLGVKKLIEVFNNEGLVILDSTQFKNILTRTRDKIFKFIQQFFTVVNKGNDNLTSAEIFGIQVAEYIMNTSETGIALLNSDNLNNRGAINFLYQLYSNEFNFYTIWKEIVLEIIDNNGNNKYRMFNNFIQRLNDRLHQDQNNPIGLKPALDKDKLNDAAKAQDSIASLFGSINEPHGTIRIYLAKSPQEELKRSEWVHFEFGITSYTTVVDTYTVKFLENGWPRSLIDNYGIPIPNNKITIGPEGSEYIITVALNVNQGTDKLQLQITSDSNPQEIKAITGLFILEEGNIPPQGESKIQLHIDTTGTYAKLDSKTGKVNVQRKKTGTIGIRISNFTDKDATFNLSLLDKEIDGSWNFEFSGDPSLTVPKGESKSKTIKAIPDTSAISLLLMMLAETEDNGLKLGGQIIIPIIAVDNI